jgi:GNAT superfamily N-acetyltransferase
MDYTIRRAAKGDTDALFALVQDFATSFTPDQEAFCQCFQSLTDDESAWLSVAESGAKIVGYCLGFDHYAFYANGRVSWIEESMVDVSMRRKGIGRALVKAFEDWAKSRGSRLVALATRRAGPFYAALGYEESATCFRKLL